jgi:hypothetical protein
MKKILIFLFAFSLSGCSLLMANYDSSEYSLVNKVRTQAIVGDCSSQSVKNLYNTTLELKNFAQYIPRNDATIGLANHLYVIVDELHKRENPSPAYCKAKLNTIAKSAEEIQRVVGNKPR